jgi:hypothetical protein
MADELLSRDYLERALKHRECFVVVKLSTAEIWMTKKNHSVTVPFECDRETFDAILADIQAHGAHD